MIALDTNVLLRYIMQDDQAQARKATKAIEKLTPEKPAFISCIVLCEVNWVLQTAYRISKHDRLNVLQDILSVSVFDVERQEVCRKALQLYRIGKADFSDYLIQQIALHEGYDTVLSFDKKAHKSPGFQCP